jgi:hypothetical protein
MKIFIAILIVVGVVFGGYKLFEYWETVSKEKDKQKQSETSQLDPRSLPGIPSQAEPALQEAYNKGTQGLKEWLDSARRSPLIKDPRLAWIELDYMVRVSRENPVEAKRIFAEVKKRTTPDSPVYRRIKELEKTYE